MQDEIPVIFVSVLAIQLVKNLKPVFVNEHLLQEVVKFCKDNEISLVAVGPEDPLANGIADALLSEGINTFGPQKNAAQIESNKEWAKAFMEKHGIPTAKWKSFTDAKNAKDFINK